jgi:phosphoesterase RecJ-like protein
MFDQAKKLINDAQKIVVIQAENPDGDSLGSSLALEEILSDLGKEVVLFCAIDIPKYMHYVQGWDRVVRDWPVDCDLAIIVDTTSKALLLKTFETPGIVHFMESHDVLVIDHHQETEPDLPFEHNLINDIDAVATGEAIYKLAIDAGWEINQQAAENMFLAIQADSLGLTTQNTTAESYRIAAELVAHGANPSEIEQRRREYMKKPADILAYKGELIGRIEYNLEGKLATIHIPWEEIEQYSDRYNPSVLVLDEMRLVDNVQIAIAVKTYPDGKLTGKIRSNIPIAGQVAGFFGGGGHEYSAGFKVFENYDKIMPELITAVDKALTDYDTSIS